MDGSIYFGSSVSSKNFELGYKTSRYIPKGGFRLDSDGFSPMNKQEISGKYSIHQSGTINTPSERKRYKIMNLDEYGPKIPLIGIMPMKPDRYPVTPKKIKDNDIILDARNYENQPFALLMFLSKTDDTTFKILESPPWNFSKSVSAFDSLFLCIYMYHKSIGFLDWPKYEMDMFATNANSNEELTFPIIKELPDESWWRNFR
ncbi:MAG: hypothetical protein JW746_09775 [Candidatus Krumholzibacteriota bacterium]|nr:hypothetical protein [Candidatus Krumholzibacteriota bacterium]